MARAKKEKLSLEELLEQALVEEKEQPYAVPSNWVWTKLKYFSELINGDRGRNYPSKADLVVEGIPFINAGALKNGSLSYEDLNYITEEKFNIINSGKVAQNDILYCLRGTLGKNALIDKEIEGAIASSLCILRANKQMDYKYLFYMLNAQIIENQKDSVNNGTAQPNLSGESVKNYIVPLPPLAEQQRIVERIESLFEKLDTAKELAQNALDSFENRKAAILHKAFTGELTTKWREENSVSLDSWEERKLEKCGKWFGGGTPTKSRIEYWTNGDIPWITPKDMKRDTIVDSEDKITKEALESCSAKLIDEPAVLFVMRSGILRRILPIGMTIGPTTVNQDMKAVIPNDINIEYLFWYCKSKERDIREKCSKSGTTVESINSKALYEYKILVPSKVEQRNIVDIINLLLSKEEKAAELLEIIEKIDLMKKAILARAFRGELGTNNPEEESAIELLKEVLKEKL